MVHDVFICHSPAGQEMSQRVCEFLEGNGIRCWIAPRNTLLGDEAAESSLNAVHTCPIMVLIFSQRANDSDTVRREVESAVQAEKVLIPFRIENVVPSGDMETYFRRRYCYDAYTPPLERHLEELARMLKPLTHQRKVFTTGDASISRTLPSRASILRRSDAPSHAAADQSAGPLQISFHFGGAVMAGRPSPVECLMENRGTEALEQVELELESRGLKRPVVQHVDTLAPGTRRCLLEMDPLRSGNFSIRVAVKFQQGKQEFAYVGTRPLRVEEAPASTDLLRRTQNLPAAPVPSDPVRQGSPKEAAGEVPAENFEPLELTLDYQVAMDAMERADAGHALKIPGPFLDRAQAGALLKLEPLDAATDMPYQEVRLVARASFGLGRSQDESDFVLWFWPRNEVHDTKTRRISKKHCTLTADRGRIHVANTAAASLTTFDGQDLTGPEGVALEGRGTLNLSGIYVLDIMRFAARHPQGPTITNLGDWKGAGNRTPGPPATGSVRFVPLTPNVLPQQATWLLTDGTFGTSRINPIVLEIDGIGEIQGRFHHFQGGFWIENLDGATEIQLDGHRIEPGTIIPLTNGQNLKLGKRSFYVRVVA